jgi:hypothetical protein
MGREAIPDSSLLIFAGEVRRLKLAVGWKEIRAIDAARQLQILWRQMAGMTLGDGGIADGTMYEAVCAALKGRR